MHNKKVICAGHVCIDLTPAIAGPPRTAVSDILVPGRLVASGPLAVNPGGSVVNTGLAMQFFGADVSFMGKIGEDILGQMLIGFLAEHDVSEAMIIEPEAETSYSVVLAVPGLDRIFIHNSGANDFFAAADVSDDALREAVLFHFGYPPLMERMYAGEGTELAALFARADELGCLTSLDMAAIAEDSKAGQANWSQILANTLSHVDFFLPSFEELCFAVEPDRYRMLCRKADSDDLMNVIDPEHDAAPLARGLIEMGCAVAVVKCGAKGFWYETAHADRIQRMVRKSGLPFTDFASQRGFVPSYEARQVVSGTGAGDVTIGAFLTAVIAGKPLSKCIDLASAAGAACVEAVDALGGLEPFAGLEARIRAGWRKNTL